MTSEDGKVLEVPASRRSVLKAGALGAAGAAWGLAPFRFAAARPSLQGEAGGRVVVGKPAEILLFDPHLTASQTSWEIHAVVYESLVFLDDALNAVPGLAERWETPDDRTYVFHLRQGVMFHNGREMTADDVVFSLRRVLDHPETWWNEMMGPTIPLDPAAAAAVATAAASGTPTPAPQIGLTIEATGPYEVRATLSQPYAPFLQALSATTTAIVPGQEVEAGELDLSLEMVGTGPFRVQEHVEDQRWVFAKHADYWQEGQPLLDEVVWQILPDEPARVAALRTGEIQIATFDNPTMLDLLANDPNVTTLEQTTTNYYILFVNGTRPPLDDQRVRQAISLAVDREQIKDLALFGRASVTGPIAAAFSDLAAPVSEVPFYTRDVARARALLAEAAHPDGLALQILVTPDLPATVTMAELIRAQVAEAGIELEIVQRDLATFVNEYSTEGTAQLAISWWAGYSDPYLILLQLASTSFGSTLGMVDQALDDLIVRSAREVDPAARLTVLRELEEAIAALGYFQPLVTRDNFVAYRKDQIGNVTFTASDGFGLPLWHAFGTMTRLS